MSLSRVISIPRDADQLHIGFTEGYDDKVVGEKFSTEKNNKIRQVVTAAKINERRSIEELEKLVTRAIAV